MFKLKTFNIILFIIFVIKLNTPVFGQWISQTITLRPGWNAVFVKVQPEPDECDAVFQGLPIESVWSWNKQLSSVQFIQDTPNPNQPEWLTYFPQSSVNSPLTNLFVIQGNRGYLIKLQGNESVTWIVKGKPISRPVEWVANSFNLMGFHVDLSIAPTFESFFAPSTAHAGKPVYRMNSQGQWEKIENLNTEKINSGEAYWIYCDGQSKYSGPININLEQGNELSFGRILTELTVDIQNLTSNIKQITIKNLASEIPPSSFPSLAGMVVLSYWNKSNLNWLDIPDQLQITIQPGEKSPLLIAVKRSDMPDNPNTLYQSILQISDEEGLKQLIPVNSKGKPDRTGLWVGMAIINKVCFSSDPSDPITPKSTASEFPIRLIIHLDNTGQAKLLQHVTLMWKEGTVKPDPLDPIKDIVDEPGRYVLIANDNLISQFSGSSIRNSKIIGRRISSATFGFSDPQAMTGTFDNTLVCDGITINYDNPLNPFKHKFHPDHDNLNFSFETQYPEGIESYTVERHIELEFIPENYDGNSLTYQGYEQIGGTYREIISGIHKKKLYVEGTFQLRHISRIPILNDDID